ncbi:endonuclease/exonuclease/phosphatase family protein [Novosphingobium pentaromativorans]|uniref:Endonuclease/exonuclease/phosphatase domain-containing protein n=1 Tax=Novosphingobium pentaromativorans US6-1 TaxID=1088721 RepID=G6EAB0_9SPHN|nr:endonuclease/exonuclease/phosphatase family protein [Novosphingobium pentaromativorans]AIT80755.1 hypothetical protein JI59_13700 [Novosphingobium pentaromativorans US6-1]EHJ61772.1 hypothetical protein NSU_1281 [Novosphingobium pentaromativorans US6-1]
MDGQIRPARHSCLYRLGQCLLATVLLLLGLSRFGTACPVLDLINLFAAPLGLASLILAAVLSRRAVSWTGRGVLALCCLPALGLSWPDPAQGPECSPSSARLRIAWLNTHKPKDPDRIAAWLDAEAPQVVGVAELPKYLPLHGWLEKRYPYWQSCLENGRCATALFTNIEPAAMQALTHGDPFNRQSLPAVRMVLPARAPDGGTGRGQGLQIFAVHLSRPVPPGRQAKELLQLDKALTAPAGTVIVGDFNLSPRMRLLGDYALRNGMSLTRTDRPTWPLTFQGRRYPGFWQIDHLLVGSDWKVEAIRTSPDVGSDHRGFVADLCRVD